MLFSFSQTARRQILSLLGGVILVGTPVAAQTQLSLPEESLPQLKRFIETAADRSPRMILRGFEEAVAEGNLLYAKSARLPNVGGFADVLKAREDRADFISPQSADKLYYRVQMTQPLFHWGVISRNIENAKLRREMEAGNTKSAMLTMMTEIRKKYLELIIQKRLVARHRFGMDLLDDELEQAIEKRQLNTLSEAQLQDVRLKHKRGQASIAYYEEQYRYGKVQFARMVGVETVTDEEIADEFPMVASAGDAQALTSLLARFAADAEPLNTELQYLAKDLITKENDLKNARMSLRPKLNLIAGVTQDEQSYTANIAQRYEFQSVFGGVGVSWTVFDGFATRGAVKAALNRLRSGERTLADREQALLEDAESIARQLKYRAIEAEVSDQELINSQNNLRYVQGQFERGEASENDLAQAQLGLSDYWRNAMQSRYAYWEAMFNFLWIIQADPVVDLIPAHRL